MKQLPKLENYDAVLFDLDGVLTATSKVHAACWKKMFDNFLQQYVAKRDELFQPFDIDRDYVLYIDGKLRDDGVKSFLESRDIHLPYGSLDDPPGHKTVYGLANLKYDMVNKVIESDGVETYDGSINLVRWLRNKGVKVAVVSSSKSCKAVLKATGIIELFDEVVDGEVATRLNLLGKPAPDTYLKAAEMLCVSPDRTVVIEDAISGIQAGCNGGFGLVIGVARRNNARILKKHGADITVADLGELVPQPLSI